MTRITIMISMMCIYQISQLDINISHNLRQELTKLFECRHQRPTFCRRTRSAVYIPNMTNEEYYHVFDSVFLQIWELFVDSRRRFEGNNQF